MDIPFTARLPRGFGQGKTLIIRGKPHHTRAWFAITFLNGCEMLESRHDAPTKGAPLHVQARLDENLVVMNTHDGRGWGSEDRKPGFPIRHDSFSEIRITNDGNFYEVFFNGVSFAKYIHRMDQHSVSHFNFYGDFKIQEVIYT